MTAPKRKATCQLIRKSTRLCKLVPWLVHDGRKSKDPWPKFKFYFFDLSTAPSPIEFFSYTFSYQTILVGPLCFYNDYLDFITGSNFTKHQVIFKLRMVLVWSIASPTYFQEASFAPFSKKNQVRSHNIHFLKLIQEHQLVSDATQQQSNQGFCLKFNWKSNSINICKTALALKSLGALLLAFAIIKIPENYSVKSNLGIDKNRLRNFDLKHRLSFAWIKTWRPWNSGKTVDLSYSVLWLHGVHPPVQLLFCLEPGWSGQQCIGPGLQWIRHEWPAKVGFDIGIRFLQDRG